MCPERHCRPPHTYTLTHTSKVVFKEEMCRLTYPPYVSCPREKNCFVSHTHTHTKFVFRVERKCFVSHYTQPQRVSCKKIVSFHTHTSKKLSHVSRETSSS